MMQFMHSIWWKTTTVICLIVNVGVALWNHDFAEAVAWGCALGFYIS